MKLTIVELIERLQQLERQRNSGAHPSFDKVKFVLDFDDPDLDKEDWDIELVDVNNWLLPGCACEVNAVFTLKVVKN